MPHKASDADLAGIVETFGDDPQKVGAVDGTEDDFGDLICEIASAVGVETDDALWGRLDRVCGESDARTMRALLDEVEAEFGVAETEPSRPT